MSNIIDLSKLGKKQPEYKKDPKDVGFEDEKLQKYFLETFDKCLDDLGLPEDDRHTLNMVEFSNKYFEYYNNGQILLFDNEEQARVAAMFIPMSSDYGENIEYLEFKNIYCKKGSGTIVEPHFKGKNVEILDEVVDLDRDMSITLYKFIIFVEIQNSLSNGELVIV